MTKYDVAVVGGGIAGLSAAIFAAKAGKRVIILEKQKQLGGRAITNKKQGVYLNLGAHALYKGEAYKTFKEWGLTLAGDQPSKFDASFIWRNQVLVTPLHPFSFIKTSLLSWKGKRELIRLFIKIYQLDPEQLNHISIRNWMELYVQDPMVRNILYAFLRTATYIIAPELQVAGPVLKQLQLVLNDVVYLDHGWGSLIEELQQLARQNHVEWRTNQQVASIKHQDQTIQSVLLNDGTIIEATNIILTTPPKVASELVPYSEQTSIYTWKEQAIEVTAACLDIGLRRLPNPKHQFILGLDQPVLFTNQSRAAKLSEDGTQVVHLIKYQGPETNPKKDEQMLEEALDLVQPGWRNECVVRRYLPKLTITYDFPHMNRRVQPGPAIPEIKGLYIAGDWVTHGESLVDASVASAKRAVDHLLQSSPFNE